VNTLWRRSKVVSHVVRFKGHHRISPHQPASDFAPPWGWTLTTCAELNSSPLVLLPLCSSRTGLPSEIRGERFLTEEEILCHT